MAPRGSLGYGTMGAPNPLKLLRFRNQEKKMDKDRIKGSVNQLKGKVKEWAGKITGDRKAQTEGKADQVKGKVQNAVGGLKDTARGK